MGENFNPYREWLGIESDGVPPDHYALFGLQRLESDADKIRLAAGKQKARVRSIRPGDHVNQWRALLDQLDTASRCLNNPEAKQIYDEQLRARPTVQHPADSVLEDPAEPATEAESSLIAEPVDSEVAADPTSDEVSQATDAGVKIPVGGRNLMPPSLDEPNEEIDENEDFAAEPEPPETQPVPSLTRNLMPPTFPGLNPAGESTDQSERVPGETTSDVPPTPPQPTSPAAIPINPAKVVGRPTPATAVASSPGDGAEDIASPTADGPSFPLNPSLVVKNETDETGPDAEAREAVAPTAGSEAAYTAGGAPTTDTDYYSEKQTAADDEDNDDLLPPTAVPTSGPMQAGAPMAMPVSTGTLDTSAAVASGLPAGAGAQAVALGNYSEPTGQDVASPIGSAATFDGYSATAETGPAIATDTATESKRTSPTTLIGIAVSILLLVLVGGIIFSDRNNKELAELAGTQDEDAAAQGDAWKETSFDEAADDVVDDASDDLTDAIAGGPKDKRDFTDEREQPERRSDDIPAPGEFLNSSDDVVLAERNPNMRDERPSRPDPPNGNDTDVPDPAETVDFPQTDPPNENVTPQPMDPPSGNDTDPGDTPESTSTLSPEDLALLKKSMADAKSMLAQRDVRTARILIDRAKRLAKSGEVGALKGQVERLDLLCNYVAEFWRAVDEGLKELPGQDLEIGNLVIHIQGADRETLSYRMAGQNYRKSRYEWPPGLVRFIAERWLNKEPKSKIFVGAFMAVEPKYGIDKAREQWQEALAGDVQTVAAVNSIMPVLDEL